MGPPDEGPAFFVFDLAFVSLPVILTLSLPKGKNPSAAYRANTVESFY